MHRITSLCILSAVVGLSLPAGAAEPLTNTARASCSASFVLNAVGDALTSGNDADVLTTALDGEKRLLRCGNERDAIGAELIAADAYGDVNRPAARCSALRDAVQRSTKLGERSRAAAIARAIATCPKT